MKSIIHVNQHKIKKNALRIKSGKATELEPVITVKTYKSNEYANEVIIYDHIGNEAAVIAYTPLAPLDCGAVCWIETNNKVKAIV